MREGAPLLHEPCKGDIKGRDDTSLPYISFVYLHAVQSAQSSQLILKCHFSVVLLLMTDIIVYGIYMTLANTERTIAVLPCEMAVGIPMLVDPARTVGFQGTYHLGQGLVLG